MNIRVLIFLCFFGGQSALAQIPDSVIVAKKHPKNQFLKGAIIPAALIGMGLYTMQGNGFYSSFEAKADVREAFPNFHTKADNYVFFIPIAGLYAFDLFSSQNRHDVGRQTMLLLSSGALMGAMVYPLKLSTNVWRPDGSNDHSFPSGHTSSAFVVAAVTDREFRDKSPWIGVGSYAIASATGVLRMMNDKHWMSDVLAGAGIGLISVHSVYYIHNRFIRNKNMTLLPTSLYGGKGLTFMATF